MFCMKKYILIVLSSFLILGCSVKLEYLGSNLNSVSSNGQDFQSVWRTTAPNEVVDLTDYMVNGFTYNCLINWGDGSPLSLVTAHNDMDARHTYANPGDYTVTIIGIFQALRNPPGDGYGPYGQIIRVLELGNVDWRSLSHAFGGATNLISVSGGVTNQVTDLSNMFAYTPSLTTVDTSTWNLSNVTTISGIFAGSAVSTVTNLSSWDITNISDISNAFSDADNLNPDVSAWNTSNVTNMSGLFSGLSFTPNVSSWNTSNVTNMSSIFSSTQNISPDVTGWDTSNVTNMSGMFSWAQNINIDLTNWDTSNVTNMSAMFSGYSGSNPDVSTLNTSSVTNMGYMFQNSSTINPNTSSWDTTSVVDMNRMFEDAQDANPDTSNWNTSNVAYMIFMFTNALSANPDVSGWNTSNVQNMWDMFNGAVSANPDVSGWSFASLTGGPALQNIFKDSNISNFNYSQFLVNLESQPGVPIGTSIHDVPAQYQPFAAAAKANLQTAGWYINDLGAE
jgi:surface protein